MGVSLTSRAEFATTAMLLVLCISAARTGSAVLDQVDATGRSLQPVPGGTVELGAGDYGQSNRAIAPVSASVKIRTIPGPAIPERPQWLPYPQVSAVPALYHQQTKNLLVVFFLAYGSDAT